MIDILGKDQLCRKKSICDIRNISSEYWTLWHGLVLKVNFPATFANHPIYSFISVLAEESNQLLTQSIA